MKPIAFLATMAAAAAAGWIALFAVNLSKSNLSQRWRLVRVWRTVGEHLQIAPNMSYTIDLQGPKLDLDQQAEILYLIQKRKHPGESMKAVKLDANGYLVVKLTTDGRYAAQEITIGSTMAIGPYFSFQVTQVAEYGLVK